MKDFVHLNYDLYMILHDMLILNLMILLHDIQVYLI